MQIELKPSRNDMQSRVTVSAVRLPFILHNVRLNYPKLVKAFTNEDQKVFDRHSHKGINWLSSEEILKEISDLKSFHLFIAMMRLLHMGSHTINSSGIDNLQQLDWRARVKAWDQIARTALLDTWRQLSRRYDTAEMMDPKKHAVRISFCRELERALPLDIEAIDWPPDKMKLSISGNIREYINSIMEERGGNAQELASLPGTKLLEWRYPIVDVNYYICTFFVFGTDMNSPWLRKGEDEKDSIFDHEHFHYALVKDPLPWDLAVYFIGKEPQHVGIFTGKNKVVSKWGAGLILEHDLLTVPAMYGEPRFFRMIRN